MIWGTPISGNLHFGRVSNLFGHTQIENFVNQHYDLSCKNGTKTQKTRV